MPVAAPDLSSRPHDGFASTAARDQHREAWPLLLAQLDQRITSDR